MYTVKQMIRKLNTNARHFIDAGDLEKGIAATETAAMLTRKYISVKGKIDWNAS